MRKLFENIPDNLSSHKIYICVKNEIIYKMSTAEADKDKFFQLHDLSNSYHWDSHFEIGRFHNMKECLESVPDDYQIYEFDNLKEFSDWLYKRFNKDFLNK